MSMLLSLLMLMMGCGIRVGCRGGSVEAVVMTGGVLTFSTATGCATVVVGVGNTGCGAVLTCTIGTGAADDTAVLMLRGGL